MAWFQKKNPESRLRFCRTAHEFEALDLFSTWDLTLAISRMSEWHNHALEKTGEAIGHGVFHERYGNGQPLLPVEVKFSFHAPYNEGDAGHGSVWKDSHGSEAFYRSEIVIHDPDRRIYEGFRRTFEHAAMSGNAFSHLTLRREKAPYITDHAERNTQELADKAAMTQLMEKVEAGEAQMPLIRLHRVAFDDSIHLKAPSWSHGWQDGAVGDARFHSGETSNWRSQPWRKPKAVQ